MVDRTALERPRRHRKIPAGLVLRQSACIYAYNEPGEDVWSSFSDWRDNDKKPAKRVSFLIVYGRSHGNSLRICREN